MRKSIFLTVLAMLTVAFLFGQKADTEPTPTKPANCEENENFPAIGVPHEYEVEISGDGYDGTGTYNWYVTQNAGDLFTETNIVNSTNDYFDVKATDTEFSSYHKAGTTTKKIGLTWKAEALLNSNSKYFLVLKYEENNGTCDAMNMKVMKIEPLNQFKLDIDPVEDEAGTAFGAGVSATVCAADVDGASFDATEDKVTYTYGENTLYYKVTASGFAGDWKPQISLPALSSTGDQKYVSAQWAVQGTDTWVDFNGLSQDASAQTLSSTTVATIPTDASGATPSETYIYKIVIDNERFETLANQTLNVATDGTYGGTNNDALKDQTDDCSGDEGVFADKDDYTIKARPTVKATSGGFIQRVQ
ncbi:hypothetical protein C7377_0583 [Balneicella halophila]|uniref:Uncharacterized protein n=1 Tax=Balneicella halophila TaxID=1537566 RepID=A0A7L4UT76_BALHA|nr:hypothetical protein [Balneicella halophila]PVX52274.1 hypothetical protein C7377_0583 [Balneicella halophila]